MKIQILNFSPKGLKSVTYQYYLFIENYIKKLKIHTLDEVMISEKIHQFEHNIEFRKEIFDKIKNAEIIFILTPVYAYLLPGQLKQFFEIIQNDKKEDIFHSKYFFAVITSVKIHDNIAIKDFKSICKKFNVKENNILSLNMELRKNNNINSKLENFVQYSFFLTGLENELKKDQKINEKIIIISDIEKESIIIDKINRYLLNKPEIICLKDFNINFCCGDMACMFGNCIYYKDDFQNIFDKILENKIIIFNFSEPSISSHFRKFFSRGFGDGQHHESIPGKQLIVINKENNLLIRNSVLAFTDMQSSHLIEILTEESCDLDIYKNLLKAQWCSENNYIPQETFLKVGSYGLFKRIIEKNGYAMPKDVNYLNKNGNKDLGNKFFRLFDKIWEIKFLKKMIIKIIPDIMISEHKKWLNKNKIQQK